MRVILFIVGSLLLSLSLSAQKSAKYYQYSLDLTAVKDDKVQVTLLVPNAKRTEAEFQMPKIVPGTYAIYDFGRFISDFKAYDAKGKELSVKRLDENRWQIESPKQLHKITYWVEDTFDTDKANIVFEPGGTNIEEGKNFTINTYGFFGYLKGEKEVPFEVQIKRPANFYGATSLERIKTAQNTDTYRIDNYFNLADMPIMYCEPDTTSLAVGGAEVMVAVYSPNKMLTAQEVMSNVKELLLAQKAYLGGTLPVDKYTFLIYLNEGVGKSGSFGALEHSYSTLFFLIENKAQALTQTIRDVAAHEFFHIVTPLNIHSEQIGNYDFINPQMSKHLWLYEGGTEYAAQHVQVKHGLYDTEAFLNDVTTKMRTADRIGTPVSFTEMSKGCLDKYEEYYGDVYAKGALLNMLLDIQLRKLSEGKYGVQEMMRDLAEKYGKDRSFKDDALFDEITAMTYPEIRAFFSKYVEGNEPLPYKEYLDWVGITYELEGVSKEVDFGITQRSVGIQQEEGRLYIANAAGLRDVGKAMGFQQGDVILTYNGKDLTLTTINNVLGEFLQGAEAGDDFTVTVRREDKEVTLNGQIGFFEKIAKHALKVNEGASPEQVKLRKAWINQ